MPQKIIRLPAPKNLSASVTETLKNRHSLRSFANEPISDADLSTLLWCSAGVTRPDGKRTVPSCLDLRTVSICVLRSDGAWRWNAKENALEELTAEDVRSASTLGQHQFVDAAPVTLVFVSEETPRTQMARPVWHYIDAGAMVQSAYLGAQALGLGGVIRASVDAKALGQAMKLPATYVPLCCFTCGHPAA